jgi:hypothetical protein
VELICPTAQAKYFYDGGLDDPNHLESSYEIDVLAQQFCKPKSLIERDDAGKIELICLLLIDPVRSNGRRLVRTESWK